MPDWNLSGSCWSLYWTWERGQSSGLKPGLRGEPGARGLPRLHQGPAALRLAAKPCHSSVASGVGSVRERRPLSCQWSLQPTRKERRSLEPRDVLAGGTGGLCPGAATGYTPPGILLKGRGFRGKPGSPAPTRRKAHPPGRPVGEGKQKSTAHFLPCLVLTQHATLLWSCLGSAQRKANRPRG